jgi:hypothetical protein
MGQISAKLRRGEHEGRTFLTYWCQGCEEPHMVSVKRPGDERGWGWDGNADQPTFTPSVLVTSGHYAPGFDPAKDTCWCRYYEAHPAERDDSFTCGRCHTFIRGGMVQFLGDCTHKFAGQTLPLPDLPPELRDGES